MQDAEQEEDKPPGVTLVLGGGGARGLAHLGVLQVLDEEGIPVDCIVANSAGAIVGAGYLLGPDAEIITDQVLEYLSSPAFRRLGLKFHHGTNDSSEPSAVSRLLTGWRRQVAMHLLFRRPSLFHSRRLEGVIHQLIPECNFEDLRAPLHVVTLDIGTGEEVVLHEGEVRPALVASCSVPGFFPPVEMAGRTLIDSGQSDNLPVGVAAELGTRPIVSVNLSKDLENRTDYSTGIEIMFRSDEIGSHWNNRLREADADVALAPHLGGRYWLDFSSAEDIVAAGAEAAREALPDLRAKLGECKATQAS